MSNSFKLCPANFCREAKIFLGLVKGSGYGLDLKYEALEINEIGGSSEREVLIHYGYFGPV